MANSVLITGEKIFVEVSSSSKSRVLTSSEIAEGLTNAEEVTIVMKEV